MIGDPGGRALRAVLCLGEGSPACDEMTGGGSVLRIEGFRTSNLETGALTDE